MPWTIHIDPEVNCAFVKRHGNYEVHDPYNAFRSLLTHSEHRRNMNILHDARDISIPTDTSYSYLSEQSQRILLEYSDKVGNCKIAIVAGDAQSYAKFHQFIVAGRLSDKPIERKAFRDIEKALR